MNRNLAITLVVASAIFLFGMLFIIPAFAATEKITDLTLEGENENHGIFIAIEGESNIMMWDTVEGYSEHFDSKLKTYNSGGFSLKNTELSIAVWAHPINETQYKLVILTSEGVERMVASVIEVTPIVVETTTNSTGIIYPKSSVGADITKYDVPTPGRQSENLDPMILTLKPQLIPDQFRLGDEFEWSGKVINARQGNTAVLEDATVTFEISRDGFVLRSYSDETNSAGTVYFEIQEIDYPEFYPEYCYDVTVTASYENKTSVFSEDFIMQHTLGTKIWEPNTSWMGLNQWNHLPTSYHQEPRPIVNGDDHCNE